MYAGHFASGMVIKARVPAASTWGILIGVGLLDLLFGPLLAAGIEHASLIDESPGFSLDYIDWSHSLATSLLWSVLYALLFIRAGRAIAIAMGAAVFSHFVLDVVMHPPDLALWPGSDIHIGFGLWKLLPTGWWFVELGFVALCMVYYKRCASELRTFGGRAW